MTRAADHGSGGRRPGARRAGGALARSLLAVVGALLAVAALGAGSAGAVGVRNGGFYIRGGGFGHGIGMSQYGAGGLALHGWSWQNILKHYYVDTTLGHVSPSRTVTVLLQQGAATFRNATAIAGSKTKLNPRVNYAVLPASRGRLELMHRGIKVGYFRSPLKVSGSGPLQLVGLGTYRGSFLFRHIGGVVQTVNALGVDDYVRGVVSAEMPSSWAQAALDAQAVAARTYVLTTDVAPGEYDAYDDTRSQMYQGVSAETPSTNAAVSATSGEVVEYHGSLATTYFFASSGGHTESIQNVWYGVAPEAWLQGVPDPYDDSYNNPYYRWRRNLSLRSAGGSLGGYYHGGLRGIRIVQRGVSPRIVKAAVVGTHGSSTVTGAELQSLFGTLSTDMDFTEIHDRGMAVSAAAARRARRRARARRRSHANSGGAGLGGTTSSGGGPALNRTPTRGGRYVQGSIFPATRNAVVTIERRIGRGWRVIARRRLGPTGTFRVRVRFTGIYRVLYRGIYGPWVRVK